LTVSQRGKEEAHDYRYFPEPDIPPIHWSKSQILSFSSKIPELPDMKLEKFMKKYGLSEYDATILTEERQVAEYFEEAVKIKDNLKVIQKDGYPKGEVTSKIIANWIINKKIDILKVTPKELIKLILTSFQKQKISIEELEKAVKKVINNNQKAVIDYKSGKNQTLMFLIGQVMREIKGKAEALTVRSLLEKALR